jgi:hypothetical protein
MDGSLAHATQACTGKRFPAIVIWGALGVVFVVVQTYVYLRWILSDDARPTKPGSDDVPAYSLISMRVFETLSMIALVIAIVWFVRGIRKTRRIDAVRLMMVGWLSAYWLDPFLNFLRPMFTYNASLVNMGSWAEFIPFFITENGNRIAEPLLVDPANYFITFTTTALSGVWAMKKATRRWPSINPVLRALCAVPAIWMAMGVLDVIATRFMHFDAWLVSHRSFSLWGGEFYQFPLIEFITFPLAFVACALVLYHQDDQGLTPIERGYNDLRASPQWVRTSLRVLAFVALCNIANWGYTTLMGVIALTGDPWPANTPTWLMDGLVALAG